MIIRGYFIYTVLVAVVLNVHAPWLCQLWQLYSWMKTCLMDHVCVLGPSSSNTGKWRTVAECAGTPRPRYTLTLKQSHTNLYTHIHHTISEPDCVPVKVHVGELGSGLQWKMAGGRSTHITARSGGCHQRGTLCSDVRGHLYIALAPGTQRRAVWTTCLVQHRCGSTCSHSHLCWRATGVSLCHPTGKTTVQRHPHPPHKSSLYVQLFQCT